MTDTMTAFSVGDRVRLTDAGGDTSSTARVGALGTVDRGAATSYDLLGVRLDDGSHTSRNAHRWEKVSDPAPTTPGSTITVDGQELRLVRLTTNTYPVTPSGTDWSGDDLVFYAKDHDNSSYVRLVVPTSDPRSSAGFYSASGDRDPAGHQGWNVERQYVVDVETPATPPATPREIRVGDHVKVTRDSDAPVNEGKSAEVLEVGVTPGPGGKPYRVKYDDGSGYGSWWVDSVELLPEEEVPATYSQEDVDRLVREARADKARSLSAEFEAWKEEANETAIRYARDNSLCGEFERCMEEIGFRGRTSDYDVILEITGTVTVTVTANNEDDAREIAADRAHNRSTLADLTVGNVDVEDIERQ